MKLGPLASLGGIAAITVLGASYLTFGVVRADLFPDYLNASLVLDDSGGLGVGSPVLLTGIEVGRVTSVDRAADGVEVGFRVDDSHRLPTDSVVTVEHLSALGEPYVQFVPKTGAGPYLRDGQRLRSEDIHSPLSIPQAARMVTRTMNQLDPATMGSLVRTLHDALHGTDAVLPELTRAADLLAATIMSREPRIAELLDNFETAAADSDWAGPPLRRRPPNSPDSRKCWTISSKRWAGSPAPRGRRRGICRTTAWSRSCSGSGACSTRWAPNSPHCNRDSLR